MMNDSTKTALGVQSLIERIRDEGVQAAQEEANRLRSEAKKQAAEMIARAQAEVDAQRAKASAEIDAYQTAALDALKVAARDTVLELKAQVRSRFEESVKRLVVSATHDMELIRSIVLVLAGQAAEQFIRNKDIEIRISQDLLQGAAGFKDETKQAVLGLSSDMLREGLVLIPDDEIEGGARVRLVEDRLEIDLSDRAIAKLISRRILPRFNAILEGAEVE
jgi:V/A-type H+-transporting ATPase subunit E